ncbi:MAG: hypothetical protein CVT67_03200 [Actinobacteria bacterium HGW-Actinobacteria-7]|jgi:hypothetical protein|nr:MAG: hypothetical protein CVT67_03200 [Actinobacteria bacterium HGW-Actinobacteria-7]
MSEQAQNNNQQMIMIALAVIAVLLAAIVGVMIWQQTRAAAPAVPVASAPVATDPAANPAADPNAAAPSTAPSTNSGTPNQAAPDPAAFDVSGATKVAKGTPTDFVTAYYEACDKGDWAAAYSMLPADKQQGQTPEGLQQQVEGYSVQSFSIAGSNIEKDKATVIADQVTASYGTFENQWTFVKKDGTWYVASKAVTGMK